MLKLFIDSDCDFTMEQAKYYDATMICMPYEMNGKEFIPYVDFETFDYHAYYDILRGGVLPTTSALSPETYKEYFEPELAKGNDFSRDVESCIEIWKHYVYTGFANYC